MQKIEKIRGFAENRFDELRWIHTKNVVKIGLELAEQEDADKEIVEISAWLHDIGITDKESKAINHHIYSARITRKLLNNLDFKTERIGRITQCIEQHMGPRGSDFLDQLLTEEEKDWSFLPRPSTIEAKVLYDADMIDLCSPFGVIKTILLSVQGGKSIKEAVDLARMSAEKAYQDLQTESGQKLGREYFTASKQFLKMLKL